MSHGITLHFVSLAALAAAIPHLAQTPGLDLGVAPGNGTPAVTPAATASTVSVAPTPVAAPAPSPINFGALAAPTFTFEQVTQALMAYHAKDLGAFGAAMQKFGFASMDAVKAAPDKWNDLLTYIGAIQPVAAAPAVEAPTLEKVGRVLQLWSQTNAAAFQAMMVQNGLTSMADVQANPAKWPTLMAAAAAIGIS